VKASKHIYKILVLKCDFSEDLGTDGRIILE
jgi:hypothetical protein